MVEGVGVSAEVSAGSAVGDGWGGLLFSSVKIRVLFSVSSVKLMMSVTLFMLSRYCVWLGLGLGLR